MSAALRSRSCAAFPIAAALLLTGCAVAAPSAENDERIEQGMQGEDLDAGTLDAALVDPEPIEPVDPGIIVPPFGSLAGTSGGTAGGTTGGGGTPGGTMQAPRDAGTSAPRDASTSAPRDAGTSALRDAGTARPPTTAPRDAGRPTSTTGGTAGARCNALTCTNECSLAGPIPCCTLLDTCGCTWAPGAYCL